jgi:hypothetical protein
MALDAYALHARRCRCRECVLKTIEGPGISKSECPTCHQPGWKNDLLPNLKYANVLEHTLRVQKLLGYDAGVWKERTVGKRAACG